MLEFLTFATNGAWRHHYGALMRGIGERKRWRARKKESERKWWVDLYREGGGGGSLSLFFKGILTNQGHNSKVSADIEYYLKSVTNIT